MTELAFCIVVVVSFGAGVIVGILVEFRLHKCPPCLLWEANAEERRRLATDD